MWCMLHHLLGHSEHGEIHTSTGAPGDLSPLDILKRRFALGEMSREQFEETARVLSAVEAPGSPAHHDRHL